MSKRRAMLDREMTTSTATPRSYDDRDDESILGSLLGSMCSSSAPRSPASSLQAMEARGALLNALEPLTISPPPSATDFLPPVRVVGQGARGAGTAAISSSADRFDAAAAQEGKMSPPELSGPTSTSSKMLERASGLRNGGGGNRSRGSGLRNGDPSLSAAAVSAWEGEDYGDLAAHAEARVFSDGAADGSGQGTSSRSNQSNPGGATDAANYSDFAATDGQELRPPTPPLVNRSRSKGSASSTPSAGRSSSIRERGSFSGTGSARAPGTKTIGGDGEYESHRAGRLEDEQKEQASDKAEYRQMRASVGLGAGVTMVAVDAKVGTDVVAVTTDVAMPEAGELRTPEAGLGAASESGGNRAGNKGGK